jgi:hypothetical protein
MKAIWSSDNISSRWEPWNKLTHLHAYLCRHSILHRRRLQRIKRGLTEPRRRWCWPLMSSDIWKSRHDLLRSQTLVEFDPWSRPLVGSIPSGANPSWSRPLVEPASDRADFWLSRPSLRADSCLAGPYWIWPLLEPSEAYPWPWLSPSPEESTPGANFWRSPDMLEPNPCTVYRAKPSITDSLWSRTPWWSQPQGELNPCKNRSLVETT